MASSLEFVQYAVDQMRDAGKITYKKMFGDYGIYCNGTIVGLICDNQLFFKVTEAGRRLCPGFEETAPYEGAKPFLLVEEMDNRELLTELTSETFRELPRPKPKKRTAEEKMSGKENKNSIRKDPKEMEFISVTKENLEEEHICCAISNNKDCQVMSKKAWLKDRFDDGLVFKKGNVRGKCFIEYIPTEKAWSPIEADGYMYIDCLWISGQFKGHGYGNLLLDECIRESRETGKLGLAALSSKKKMPYLSDPHFLRYKGFQSADTAEPYFELFYLPFQADAPKPQFKEHAKNPHTEEKGFVLYYTQQCPFTAKYVPLIERAAKEKGIMFRTVRLETAGQAQNAPSPFTSYSLFHDGRFITNEILSEKKFEKILEENGVQKPSRQ